MGNFRRAGQAARAMLVIGCVAFTASGCGSGESADTSGAQTAGAHATTGDTQSAGKPVKLAFFSAGTANGFSKAEADGVNAAAKKLGADVTVFDGKFDVNTQISQLQTANAQGKFDAYVVNPVGNQQVVPALQQAAEQGVKVVCIFTACGGDLDDLQPQVPGQTAFVGLALGELGTLLAEQTVKACGSKAPCRVAFMQGMAALASDAVRTKAFEDAIKQHPDIKLVSVQEGQLAEQPANAAATNVLTANPDLDVYVVATDQMAAGVARAIGSTPSATGVKVLSLGASKEGVEAVKDGTFLSTVVTLPYSEGETGATLAIKAARGADVEPSIGELSLSEVGPVVTRTNAETFQPQWQN